MDKNKLLNFYFYNNSNFINSEIIYKKNKR